MATGRVSQVIHSLRQAMLRHNGAGLTDGQLLDAFIERREAAAFAALVQRHGPMVWGVCLRVLGNYHDAEDAFQATFLVLVRKAACILPREMVANWLYGVARQTALKARATISKRRRRERQAPEMPEPAVAERDLWNDLQPLLDQELNRLPDKYRVAVVLCDLECKTRKEVARQLGLPEGTVASRLATARTMLAKRLARHGLIVSLASLPVVSSQGAAASVPASLLAATVQAVSLGASRPAVVPAQIIALTQGVLNTMLLTKLKIAATVLLVVAGGIGAGEVIYHSRAAQLVTAGPETKTETQGPSRRQRESAVMKELDNLQGTWILTALQQWGRPEMKASKDGRLKKDGRFKIEGDQFTFAPPGAGGKVIWTGLLKIDPTQQPKTMDWAKFVRAEDKKSEPDVTGIYELKGDTLTFCYGNKRPTEFQTRPDRDLDERMFVFEREKRQ
jgi:RNA polymerase sigma factor (sigma-70 family)